MRANDLSVARLVARAVPHAERGGAIVKGEHGLPIRERSYRRWFRAIARAAVPPG
jgi:hypothetical protein